MGCDRNLFTLRLVLNQTRGEWQWQAAAEGWGMARGGGAGAVEKTAGVCHVAQVQHYNLPAEGGGSSPRPSGRDRRMERREQDKGTYEENKR